MTKKTKLVILIPVGAVLLNGLGYLIAINLRTPPPSKAADPALAPREALEGGRADRQGERSPEEREREDRALARRAAGLAALEAGDYDRAIAAFAEARAAAGDKAYVAELMRVAEELARRPPPPPARRAAAPRPAKPSPVARWAGRSRPVERTEPTVAQEPPPPPEAPPPPPPAPASGLLLVTTTPRGLLVQIDEVPLDLTPTRASLKVGSHHVALFDGDNKVYETNVDVKPGTATTLLKDLSAAVAPATRPRSPLPSLAKEDAPSPPAAAPLESPLTIRATPAEMPPLPPPRPRAAVTGALEITSPGLYGEVWINGRPWGFPPLRAGDLPAGPTRVGVRVNGIEERSATVAVVPGQTTAVRLSR